MGKYYVGFDVGIKNLAFCVIDSEIYKKYNESDSNCNSGVSQSETTNPASQDSGGALHAPTNCECNSGVIEWVNINLIENKTCCGVTKKGDVCGKTASFVLKDSFYCGTHKLEGSKKYKQKNTKNQNMEYFLELLFRELDKYPILKDAHSVVIESQPRFNPKMKTLSSGIQSYFIIRNKIDFVTNLKTVGYSSSKNKLKVWKGEYITSPKTTKYQRTKDIGQQHTELILARSPETLEKFYNNSKKKDDLADAFLHCVYSLRE